jgi:hypothetical protein
MSRKFQFPKSVNKSVAEVNSTVPGMPSGNSYMKSERLMNSINSGKSSHSTTWAGGPFNK